jgi:hypothetical protein
MASTRTLSADFRPYAEAFIGWLQDQGLRVTVTSARRSSGEQARLYARFKAGKSKYPAAPPGTSTHELGYAFDAVVSPPEYQDAAGQAWEQMGGRWGGRFRDPVHFEAPGIAQAARSPKTLSRASGFVGGSRGPKDEPIEQVAGPHEQLIGQWWFSLIPGYDQLVKYLSS